MTPGGLLLMVAGAWMLTQVLGGDALGRLGVLGQAVEQADEEDDEAPDGRWRPPLVGGN